MKKINSNSYGGKVIGIGLIFLIVIPVLFWGLNKLLPLHIFHILGIISFIIGCLIEGAFFTMLSIELRQDRKIARYYDQNPTSKKTPQEILDTYQDVD